MSDTSNKNDVKWLGVVTALGGLVLGLISATIYSGGVFKQVDINTRSIEKLQHDAMTNEQITTLLAPVANHSRDIDSKIDGWNVALRLAISDALTLSNERLTAVSNRVNGIDTADREMIKLSGNIIDKINIIDKRLSIVEIAVFRNQSLKNLPGQEWTDGRDH